VTVAHVESPPAWEERATHIDSPGRRAINIAALARELRTGIDTDEALGRPIDERRVLRLSLLECRVDALLAEAAREAVACYIESQPATQRRQRAGARLALHLETATDGDA
jgi:hypothetical protein